MINTVRGPFPVNAKFLSESVNTSCGPGLVDTNWEPRPGPANANWGPEPVNANWGQGPGAGTGD